MGIGKAGLLASLMTLSGCGNTCQNQSEVVFRDVPSINYAYFQEKPQELGSTYTGFANMYNNNVANCNKKMALDNSLNRYMEVVEKSVAERLIQQKDGTIVANIDTKPLLIRKSPIESPSVKRIIALTKKVK